MLIENEVRCSALLAKNTFRSGKKITVDIYIVLPDGQYFTGLAGTLLLI